MLEKKKKAETLLCQQRSAWSRLWFFQSCMDGRVGLWRKLSAEELMLLNCCVGEDPWESLGLQGDPTSPSWRRSVLGVQLEGLMLKLKLQYFGHLMRRVDSLEKTLMLGGTGGRRRRGWQRMRWLMASPTPWTWVWVNSRSWWWTGRPGVLRFIGSQSQTWLSNWTDWLNRNPQILTSRK